MIQLDSRFHGNVMSGACSVFASISHAIAIDDAHIINE